jgi:hypothetical protein
MASETISGRDFLDLISRRSRVLLEAAQYLSTHAAQSNLLTRPLLGDILSHASQIEELLDAYGARNNQQWQPFRSLVATIKLYSNVGYELLHVHRALPSYHLLSLQRDFGRATEQTLDYTCRILAEATAHFLIKSAELGISIPPPVDPARYEEHMPEGRLEQNLATRKSETVAKTVTLLATAFLNLAAESKPTLPSGNVGPEEYEEYLKASITEERLRSLEFRFHNLQSLYDTYVSKTETEDLDPDLSVLRGHISVVMHLLRIATDFCHYYERHIQRKHQVSGGYNDPQPLLSSLMNYAVSFAGNFLASAEVLCQNMLKRYTEIGTVEVTVPQYRGFHVRPSTLVSKLVLHYGSRVKMELDNEYYDAASPLELFRANEKINAQKRKWLAEEILRLQLVPEHLQADQDIRAMIHTIVMTLAETSKLIIYEHPLTLKDNLPRRDSRLMEQVTDEIARLQAHGKIDIGTNLKIRFIGDKRVLSDIKLLADSGYGEDNFGNNIPLPEGLAYLRR